MDLISGISVSQHSWLEQLFLDTGYLPSSTASIEVLYLLDNIHD